jgi:ferrous iron transport protein B
MDFSVDYGSAIEEEITNLQRQTLLLATSNAIKSQPGEIWQHFPSRWLAIKLLEQDSDIHNRLETYDSGKILIDTAAQAIQRLRDVYGEEPDFILADRRYSWIHSVVNQVITRPSLQTLTFSEKIDRIVINRFLGIPIFLALMALVFKSTADAAAPLHLFLDDFINAFIVRGVVSLLEWVGWGNSWLQSLLVNGVIAGVGGVLSFVPALAILYLALAVLEDSGYMARAAFITDRLMRSLGLHGKSFMPMIVGFGCSVPAFYTTRTLEDRKDRILTSLMVPFMSCSARLPIYVLLAGIFFAGNSGIVVFSLYLLGILTAFAVGFLLKFTLFKGKEISPFVMELPPYRLPNLRALWRNIWERTFAFIQKAMTVILAASVVEWLLLAIPAKGQATFGQVALSDSAFAWLSGLLAPIFTPLGFGNWQGSGALIAGIMGKEIIVSTMTQVYTNGQNSLASVLQQEFNQVSGGHASLAALAFMVFALTYTPCLAALIAERAEFGTRWMLVSAIGQFVLAWLLAFIVFQGGLLLGF